MSTVRFFFFSKAVVLAAIQPGSLLFTSSMKLVIRVSVKRKPSESKLGIRDVFLTPCPQVSYFRNFIVSQYRRLKQKLLKIFL